MAVGQGLETLVVGDAPYQRQHEGDATQRSERMITNKNKECTVNIRDIVTDNRVRETVSFLYEGIDELEDVISELLHERHIDGSANLRTINAQLNRRIAHLTATHDDYIVELEDKLADRERQFNELDSILGQRSAQVEKLIAENATLAYELERWKSTAEVLADKDLMAQIEESEKEWAQGKTIKLDDLIADMDRFSATKSVSKPSPPITDKTKSMISTQYHRISTLKDENAALELRIHELIDDTKKIENDLDLRSTQLEMSLRDLESERGKSAIFEGGIEKRDERIRELEEMSDIDERAWKKRESELLQMIADRYDHVEGDVVDSLRYATFGVMRKRIEELKHALAASEKTIHNLHRCIDCITDEKQKIDVAFRDTIDQRNRLKYQVECDATNLELLDAILKVINPLTRQPTSHLSREMQKLCDIVVTFRKSHNIVGASV